MDELLSSNNCRGTFVYLNRITINGNTQQENDINLNKFLDVANEAQLTFNDDKCVFSTDSIDLLGY